jgi:hypothetical protein
MNYLDRGGGQRDGDQDKVKNIIKELKKSFGKLPIEYGGAFATGLAEQIAKRIRI